MHVRSAVDQIVRSSVNYCADGATRTRADHHAGRQIGTAGDGPVVVITCPLDVGGEE